LTLLTFGCPSYSC